MNKDDLKKRIKKFSVAAVLYYKKMPGDDIKYTIGKQLLRAATSVGANYRAACRGRSAAAFIAKMGICEEESDECMFWIEILLETGYGSETLKSFWKEADELTRIFVSTIKTSRANLKDNKR
jgi:four helix bundle protein